jgi:pyruvate kinase
MPSARITTPSIPRLLANLEQLREDVDEVSETLLQAWRPCIERSEFLPSAANLAAYIALRRNDLRSVQDQLVVLGLSSLGRCESHVRASLDAVITGLALMAGRKVEPRIIRQAARAIISNRDFLSRQTSVLLGPEPNNRRIRFMVTLPAQAASDYSFVRDLAASGMDCARINCAHDGASLWRAMVKNVRKAERETGRPCRILMDLAGPKLRTGPMRPGPPILHIKTKRDPEGQVMHPANVIFDASGQPGHPGKSELGIGEDLPRLAVDADWLKQLQRGDRIAFRDGARRKRTFKVEKRLSKKEVLASIRRSAYISEGTPFELKHQRNGKGKRKDLPATVTGAFLAEPETVHVCTGDLLLLTRTPEPGEARRDADNHHPAAPAHIACSEPGVFEFLNVGQTVYIDDGRIQASISEIVDEGAWLRINQARAGGDKIGADKGLNFPDAEIRLPALSAKDLQDLDFVVKHADIVGLSFVKNAADVDLLIEELARRNGEALGIIAKIETRSAVKNLPDIIVHGAGRHSFGIMIARGDLAVEIGYERMAEIQEEILWLCEAAHVPVTWATQVLETLVKQGIPSRAEITDAAMSERAECVMLNKGPYILHALAALESVITRMQTHQFKKTAQYRALHW